jgi:peptidoglycan hydrolase-like protein with peptidoglycan-binding domain
MSRLPLVPGDSGDLVKEMQRALIAKGFSVGPAGAHGKFDQDTLSALEAFQDNQALAVQPRCDKSDWAALGLPHPR